MTEESKSAEYPDVRGRVPLVHFDISEAHEYMVQVLGRKERIPQRFSVLEEGKQEILMCMKLRYGERHLEDIDSLLESYLSSCRDDEDIWGDWRRIQAARKHEQMLLARSSRPEQRILDWNEGNDDYRTGAGPRPIRLPPRRTPIFTSDSDFERRVDNLNGSRVASNLSEATESRRHLIRHFSPNSEAVPWEQQRIRAPLGKVKETVGKVFDKARKIKK